VSFNASCERVRSINYMKEVMARTRRLEQLKEAKRKSALQIAMTRRVFRQWHDGAPRPFWRLDCP
jgi:hypothetical protein